MDRLSMNAGRTLPARRSDLSDGSEGAYNSPFRTTEGAIPLKAQFIFFFALFLFDMFHISPFREPKILFVRSGEIWIMNPQGENQEFLTQGDYPRFSPDGSKIVFSLWNQMYIMDIKKRKSRIIELPHKVGSPDWAPDGKKIVYCGFKEGGLCDLFLLSVEDGSTRNITQTENIGESHPRFSPDGRKILFFEYDLARRDFHICLINPDGSGRLRIKTDRRKHDYEVEPDWSPDGRSIVFSSRTEEGFSIFLMDMSTGKERKLVRLENMNWARNPIFSPDGRKIAFQGAVKEAGNKLDIFIQDIKGGKPINITNTMGESEFIHDWFDPQFAYPVDVILNLLTMWGTIKRSSRLIGGW